MPARALGPVALVSAVAVTIWLVSGVAVFDIVRFLGYEIVFVALPGAALFWAVRGRRPDALVAIAIGWPLGQTLEILAFVATAALGERGLFFLYPLFVLAISASVIWRRRHAAPTDSGEVRMSGLSMWAAAAAISVAMVYLALMFLPTVPLPSSPPSVDYNVDFVFFIGLIGQALNHWPLTSPGLSGSSLHYEWFVFLHMAAVGQVTQLDIPTIALRLEFVPTIVVLGCQLLALGRAMARSAWVGVLAIVAVFLLGPLDLTTNGGGDPFAESFSYHLWTSWTFLFGLTFLLPLLHLINERLQMPTWRTRRDVPSWVLIGLLLLGASGAKATILPVILSGVGLYIVIAMFRRRRPSVGAGLAALGLGIVIFAATFLIIYGTGGTGTPIDPFVSLSRTFPMVAAEGIANATLRHLVLPFAYAAGVAGVLLPLAGSLYLLRRRHRGELDRYALCICTFVAGLAISTLVHQISFSEQYFLDTGFVAGCVVAAAGLRLAWLDAGVALPISPRSILAALAASFAALIATILATSHTVTPGHALLVRYVVLGAGCIALVVGCSVVIRRRNRSASGAWALALIPLLAASALTSPILVAPSVNKIVSGRAITIAAPDPGVVWGLTPELLTALEWLRNHTPAQTVFAVNNHWINPAETDGRYYYYSAFSEREVFVEAYDSVRYGIPTGSNGPAEMNFAYRQALNNEVFDGADAQALSVLTRAYSVRFLFIDRTHGTVDPAVAQLGRVVFTNQAAIIVAVG